jgi:hypothetical protein
MKPELANNRYRRCLARLVRISFCGMPALLWGGLFAIFEPTIGGMCAIAGFWLGWQCTEAKPERGESDNPNEKSPCAGATEKDHE